MSRDAEIEFLRERAGVLLGIVIAMSQVGGSPTNCRYCGTPCTTDGYPHDAQCPAQPSYLAFNRATPEQPR